MEGTVFANRYELLEFVGSGGMAVVYKAKDNSLNRFVAVKILRDEFKENEDFIRRFNIESQAAACLSHQNIVQIYDVGEEEGRHYIVMEYLEGLTLKQYIDGKGGRLSWREAANFSMQICRALEHAHSKNVVHRDIKPQNIVITEGNKLKVADFGIARAANNSTTVNTAVGSAHYLSPEQARGGYTDQRSDLYSLGVVMYEMFTGKLPFDAETGVAVLMKHLEEEPTPPLEINPDMPTAMGSIILKAMEKKHSQRYENATEILEDLIAVYQNPSVSPAKLNAFDDEVDEERIRADKKQRAMRHAKKDESGKAPIVIGICSALLIAFIITVTYLMFFNTGKEVEIPSFVGMTFDEATRLAESSSTDDVEITVLIDRTEHSEQEQYTIIEQSPKAGSSIKHQCEVKVVISDGPIALIMDDYKGREYKEIKAMLKKKGIKVILKETEDDSYPDGTIVSQIPEEGTELAKGDEVTLGVAKGATNTVVPRVVGSTLDEALVAIEGNGLKVGIVKKQASKDVPKGKVIKQSIAANETVPVGTVIDLYISNGNKEETSSSQESEADKEAEKKKVAITLDNLPQDRKKVKVRLVSDGTTYYEKDFQTGSGSVTVNIEINKSLSLDVYYDGVYATTKEVKY